MRVLALTPSLADTSPALRFRIEQWAPHLEREGVHLTFAPFEDQALHDILHRPGRSIRKGLLMLQALVRRLALATRARDHDLVFLHREAALLGPALVERLLARRNVPLVYDFDDPIWMPYRSPTNGLFSVLKCPGKTATICRLASAVMVGNRLLATWASQHTNNVHVVPSTIEMGKYPPRPAQKSGDRPVTLGWTGSHSTLPFLRPLEQPLRELATRRQVRLLVISHTDSPELDWGPVEVIGRRWNAATEAADLHDVDIGLAPFPDTGWTPWRCHGKVLQYMALGIPTVASRIGILPDYITDGQQGFLVSSNEEWIHRITILLDDPALRSEMGARSRRTIEERYSAHVWAPRVRAVFESVARPSHNAAG